MSQTADCSPQQSSDANDTNAIINATLPEFMDKHTLAEIKISMVSISAFLVVFSGLAVIALSRTKRIPKTACILSTTLLFFDSITVLTYAIRTVITDVITLNILTLVGIGWASSSFINVAIMAFDRLLLFQWPYFYARRFTSGSYVIVYYVIMGVFWLIFTGHWLSCFILKSEYKETRECMLPLITTYMTISQSASVLVCIPSFIWIVVIIIKQKQKTRSKSERNPTIVVFVCCVNYILSSIGVFVLIYTICSITIIVRRTASDVIQMVNVLVDTVVYVLWFKECRYELLKLIGCLIPPLQKRLERMRNEVLDVHSSDQGHTMSSALA